MNLSMKQLAAWAMVATIVWGGANCASAATVASYSFTGNVNPSNTGVGRSLSVVTGGSGLLGFSAASNQLSSYHWNGATLAEAQTNNDFIEFTITPTLGYFIDLTSIEFKHTKGHNKSPSTLALLINGTQVGADIATSESQITATVSPGLTHQTIPLAIRIYGWGGETQPSRFIDFDDIILNGEAAASASMTADVTASPAARVMLDSPNVKYSVEVANDALPAGTSVEGLDYVLDLIAEVGLTLDPPTSGTDLAPGPAATHTVSVDTSTTGAKSGSVSVTSSNAWRTNGVEGETNFTEELISVAVVDEREVTATLVDFGTVITGAAVSGLSNLATTGNDDERTRITVADGLAAADSNGIALTTAAGNEFNDAADTGTRSLAGNISGNGTVTGSFGLNVTGEGLDGEGEYADVQVEYTALVLEHSDGEFANVTGPVTAQLTNSNDDLLIDFGNVLQGSGTLEAFFDILAKDLADLMAELELDEVVGAPTQGPFTLSGNTTYSGQTKGTSQPYGVSFNTLAEGTFSATWLFRMSDEDLPGASAEGSQVLTLNVLGNVVLPAPEPSTGVLGMIGVAVLAARRRKSRG